MGDSGGASQRNWGPFDLAGRVALVTGAGRGLGRAIAVGLAEAGADLAVASRSKEQLESLAQEVVSRGHSATTHRVDVLDLRSIHQLVSDVLEQHGHIDILVNNAGAKAPESVLDVSEETWDLVLGTNLKGAFFVAQAVGRGMLVQGHGKIINVASTYALVGAAGRATYAASKGGLLQLTRVMASEWASRGINVNAIGPTAMSTPMNEALFSDSDWQARTLERIPAGRFCAPRDVVGAVIFLASSASDMVHGHLLLIDGGWTIV
jgi:NAD(P)-dependent dehydrogenase (short-subunit alcohol dehydrogenase family)